jgi:hypothetical protein
LRASEPLLAIALVVIALAVVGGRGALRWLAEWREQLAPARTALLASAVAVAAVGVLAMPHVEPGRWFALVGWTTVGFVALACLATRARGAADAVWSLTLRAGWLPLALLSATLSLLVARFVLGDFPHVSDEIAYQFQARAIAHGRWFVPTPPAAEAFETAHTLVDGARWYGIFPPGWPALLAAGYRLAIPWLVNPLLAIATVGFFHAFTRRAGLDAVEQRLATAIVALSPFFVFLNGTYMSHTASLFCFVVFLWSGAALHQTARLRFAVVAALALAGGLLVRNFDMAAACAPIAAWLAWRALARGPARGRAIAAAVVIALGGAAAVGATLLYQRHLTGDAFTVPAIRCFELKDHGRFGIGFGADMGTSDHGAEFPGYWPSDAIRVTCYRLSELITDLGALPLALFALPFLAPAAWRRRQQPWARLAMAAGVAVVAAYTLHFYHGVAYGGRHYFLALPGIAIAAALLLAAFARSDGGATRPAAKALWLALLLQCALFAYPARIGAYSGRYRGSSAELRDAMDAKELPPSIVFVADGQWGWKFAAPLNGDALAEQHVIYARDLGERNAEVAAHFPGRTCWTLRIPSMGGAFELRPWPPPAPEGGP